MMENHLAASSCCGRQEIQEGGANEAMRTGTKPEVGGSQGQEITEGVL